MKILIAILAASFALALPVAAHPGKCSTQVDKCHQHSGYPFPDDDAKPPSSDDDAKPSTPDDDD